MRKDDGTVLCDGCLYVNRSKAATHEVNVWGGIWAGEVSDLCDTHTDRVRRVETTYDKVRYTKIKENI